jgi:hypothetical protein
MYSRYGSIAVQVTRRSVVSASSGNHSRMRTSHSASVRSGPDAAIPAAMAAEMYLPTVFLSMPRFSAISLWLTPACQLTKISTMSVIRKVLLAIRRAMSARE